MSDQAELFDVASTQPQACPTPGCGAIRLAGQTDRIVTCQHDLEPEHRRRPRACLNAIDPATTSFPEGY